MKFYPYFEPKKPSPVTKSLIKRVAIYLILLIASSKNHADTATERPLLKFIGASIPPAFYLGENNRPQGPIADLARDIASGAGYQLDIELAPVDESFGKILRGQAQMTIMVDHPKLNVPETIISSPYPVGYLVLNVYHRPEIPRVKSLQDLQARHLVMLENYSYGGARQTLLNSQEPPHIDNVATTEQALLMVRARRADYALLYLMNLDKSNERQAEALKQFSVSTLSRIPFFIKLSTRANHDAQTLMQQLMDSYNRQLTNTHISTLNASH